MGLNISGLNELRERLERLRPEEVMARALAEQAARMAARVRDGLSEPPGAAGHDEPWLQGGALRDSVGSQANGLQAVVGSSDPAAIPQEMGTAHMPARPFLAPVAAGMGGEVARDVAKAMVAALKGEPEDGAVILADTSSSGQTHSVPYNPLGIFVPGSPENEEWTHDTIQRLQDLGHILRSERQDSEGGDDAEGVQRPPPGSKPIDQTPGSGDHAAITGDVGAKPDDDTRISPSGDVWSQNPDGTWTNYGPASGFTGSGRPSGRRGKDRK